MTPSLFHRLTLLSLIWASLLSTGSAASYIRPNESKELFQLEKIPLQVNQMKELSKLLTVIALRPQDNTPIQCRASAQLLALAMRLDPINQNARKMDKAFSLGKAHQASSADQTLKALAKLRFYSRWLASPDAGSQANRLASYLTDATKTLNPETINTNDSASWAGVLPNIDQYPQQSKPRTPKTDTEKSDTSLTEDGEEIVNDDPPAPEKPTAHFHISKLSVLSPLITTTRKKYPNPNISLRSETPFFYRTLTKEAINKITVTITPNSSKKRTNLLTFSPPLPVRKSNLPLKIPPPTAEEKITALLKARHSTPARSKILIHIKNGRYAHSNHAAITAPIAVMLEASLTNQPLRSDLHLCATINAKGKLTQPKNFWQFLGILRHSDTGGRLIISSESVDLITQLLVFEEPDFFTRWEVLTAKDLDQAMELAVQTSPANITEASALFKSIQTLAQKTDVPQLTTNHAVRKRLAEILKLSPNHLSASLLLLQGGGKRPIRLSELALAHDLSPLLKQIRKTLSSAKNDRLPSSESLKKSHANFHAKINLLEKRVDRSSGDLYEGSVNLISDFRRLGSISRRISNKPRDHIGLNKLAADLLMSLENNCETLQQKARKTIDRAQ